MKPHFHIPQQVPDFVRAEYPAFVEFLQAYYKWFQDEYSLGKIEDLVDLDRTVTDFVQYFRNQLDVAGVTLNQDNPLYLQHIKELYTAKGSTASYEFLFKLLFNKNSNTFAPWEKVLIPSNGQWSQEVSILVNIDTGDHTTLVGTQLFIQDVAGQVYSTFVNNTNDRGDGVVEIFINRITPYDTLTSFRNNLNTVTGTVLNTTTRAVVERAGSGFEIGQVFNVATYGGEGTLIKVKSIDSNGGITAVDIVRFGTGFSSEFNLLVTPTESLSAGDLNSFIQLGGLRYETNNNASPQNEAGTIVSHNYTDLTLGYFNDPTYVGQTVATLYQAQTGAKITPDVNYASIRFDVAQQCIYPGSYASGSSVLDDDSYIQDSRYYQVYSYVTVVEEALEKYSTALKKILHPAGTKQFAEFRISNTFELQVNASTSFNFISKDDAIQEIATIVDQAQLLVTLVVTPEAITTVDDLTRIVSFVRAFADALQTTDDDIRFTVTKPISEVISAIDDFSRVVEFLRTFNHTATTNDSTRSFDITSTIPLVTAAATDLITTTTSFVRAFEDTAINADTVELRTTKAVTESLAAVDVYSQVASFNRTLTSTATSSDTPTLAFEKAIVDAATSTDLFLPTTSFVRSLADTAFATDVIDYTFLVFPTSSVVATDVITPVTDWTRSYTDTTTSADALSIDAAPSPYQETIAATDVILLFRGFVRDLPETVTVSDAIELLRILNSSVATSTAVTDLATRDIIKTTADTAVASDNTVVQTTKYNSETVNTATGFGGLYMDPLYVLQDTPYWYPDYLENERVISN